MGPPPVIPLGYAKERPPPFWGRVARWMTLVSWVVGLVGWGFIWYDTESVLFSAPVLFTAGLLMIIGGALAREIGALLLGVIHCGTCLLFVALVNLLNWGPNEARAPFQVMGAIYVLISSVMTTGVVLFGRRADTIP